MNTVNTVDTTEITEATFKTVIHLILDDVYELIPSPDKVIYMFVIIMGFVFHLIVVITCEFFNSYISAILPVLEIALQYYIMRNFDDNISSSIALVDICLSPMSAFIVCAYIDSKSISEPRRIVHIIFAIPTFIIVAIAVIGITCVAGYELISKPFKYMNEKIQQAKNKSMNKSA